MASLVGKLGNTGRIYYLHHQLLDKNEQERSQCKYLLLGRARSILGNKDKAQNYKYRYTLDVHV